MSNDTGWRAYVAVALFTILMSAHPAAAQNVVDPGTSVGSVPEFPGTGLFGLYYDNQAGFSSDGGGPSQASFTTTNLCFPDCQGNSFSDTNGGLVAFTNGNATNITFTASGMPPRNTWNNSELTVSGFIAIPTPGTYTITIGSDDNTTFSIGNQSFQVLGGGPQSMVDTFTAAGLYPVSGDFMELTGASRLSVVATDAGGNCIFGCYDSEGQIEPNDLFYSEQQLDGAPVPVIGGGWPGIAATTLLGAGMAIHRHRRTMTVRL